MRATIATIASSRTPPGRSDATRDALTWRYLAPALALLVACDAAPTSGEPPHAPKPTPEQAAAALVDPDDPYGRDLGDLGTLAHQERHANLDSLSSSWDGLLHFGVQTTWLLAKSDADTAGDRSLRLKAHGLANGDIVHVAPSAEGAAIPAPLHADTDYVVAVVNADRFQLLLAAGATPEGPVALNKTFLVGPADAGPASAPRATWTYTVTALRAQNLFATPSAGCIAPDFACGLPDFTRDGVWSPSRRLGWTAGDTPHVTIFKDPSAGPINPARVHCEANLQPTPDPNGPCLAYRFGLISAAVPEASGAPCATSADCTDPGETCEGAGPTSHCEAGESALTLRFGTVVVADAATQATLLFAGFDDPGDTPHFLTFATQDGTPPNKLWRYEPSVSQDGHLIVWQGFIDNDPRTKLNHTGAALYSVNSSFASAVAPPFTPGSSPWTGWSPPRGIQQMYATHGAGAVGAAQPWVDGVRFSERYPIAKHPLTDADGVPLNAFHPCAYPWLSFDGSELFFPQVRISDGGQARSAMVAIGARTGWRLQHLDGAINPTRSTLLVDDDDVRDFVSETTTQAVHLIAGYSANALGDDALSTQRFGPQLLKTKAEQRLFVGALALSASMWSPFANATSPLPRDSRPGVYAFLLSVSKRYVEVALTDFEDGSTILHLPMNEKLAYDHDALDALITVSRAWALGTFAGDKQDAQDATVGATRALAHLTDQTPDVVAMQHGALSGGAQFPYERHAALVTWATYWTAHLGMATPVVADAAAAIAGDRIEGAVGNAIYFPATGKVSLTLAPESLAKLDQANASTVELWFRQLEPADGPTRFGLFDGVGARIEVDGSNLVAHAGVDCQVGVAPASGWHHVGLVRNVLPDGADGTNGPGGALTLFLDGARVCHVELGGVGAVLSAGTLATGSDPLVIVGPAGGYPDAALVLVDEVVISAAARTPDELRQAALRYQAPFPVGGLERFAVGPMLAGVPQGPVPAGLAGASPAVPVWAQAPTPNSDPIAGPDLTAIAELGRKLFVDKRLSFGGTMSCATCHDPSKAFIDARTCPSNSDIRCLTSHGESGAAGTRNAPGIGNRLLGPTQFWDGRAPSLEDQMAGPLTSPIEMANPSVDALVTRMATFAPSYAYGFQTAFGTPGVTAERLGQALATYQRTVLSGDARYDRGMLTPKEQRGEALFFGKARCSSCHRGPNFSDERFRNPGLPAADPNHPELAVDGGRMAVTGRPSDGRRFKTPSLRDVARTAPYYHDGRFATLGQVLDFYNLGSASVADRDLAIRPLGLTGIERQDIVAFLRTLSGSTMTYNANGKRFAPAPELVAAGSNTALWVVGWHFDDDVTVGGRDAQPRVEVATDLAFSQVRRAAKERFIPFVTPAGYRGRWQQITFTAPAGIDPHADLYVRVVSGDRTSNTLRVTRK